MSTQHDQGAVGAETKTAADPDINKFGRVVWHSSDADSGPDVGVTIGFGSGRALWFGEISKKMHEEEGAEAAELGSDLGTWIILYDDNKPRGEQATVIGKAIPYVGTDVCDAISASLNAALYTPAPRTDGGMTVGEIAHNEFCKDGDRPCPVAWGDRSPDFKAAWERTAATVLASATPAQPAGAVPDGLRALSKRWAETIRNSQRQNGKKDWISLHDTEANEITKLLDAIASHPAGQSAGSGVEDARAAIARWVAIEGAADTLILAADNALDGSARTRSRLKEAADEMQAAINVPEPNTAWMRTVARPAPDSTRTGQGEVDVRHIDVFGPVNGMNELDPSGSYMRLVLTKGEIREERLISLGAAEVFNAVLDGKLWAAGDSPLAARPAAPEAQGAWIKIDKAPGGEIVLVGWWGTVGDQRRWFYDVGPTPHGEETHYQPLPAPPASSGREGAL